MEGAVPFCALILIIRVRRHERAGIKIGPGLNALIRLGEACFRTFVPYSYYVNRDTTLGGQSVRRTGCHAPTGQFVVFSLSIRKAVHRKQ